MFLIDDYAGFAKREEIDDEAEDELAIVGREAAEQDLQGMLRAEKDPYNEMDEEI